MAIPLSGTSELGLVRAEIPGRSADELKRLALRIVGPGQIVALLGSAAIVLSCLSLPDQPAARR